jgi:protein TonB
VASILVHGAAWMLLRRVTVPSPPETEASMLWVRIVEPASAPAMELKPGTIQMAKAPPRHELVPTPEAARTAEPESPVAMQEAAASSLGERPPAMQQAPSLPQVTSASRESPDTALLIREYAQGVSRFLDARKRYPPVALARGWHGVVTLELEVLRAGDLDFVEVLHSSGYPLLDSTAVSIAKSAQPFPAFAASLPSRVAIHVDVVFRIAN